MSTSGNTRDERLNQLVNFRTNTVLYGTNSIKSKAVKAWNDINIELHYLKLQDVSKSVCKRQIYEYLLDKYPGNTNTNSRRNINNGRNNSSNNNNRTNNRNNNSNTIININNQFDGIQVLQTRRNNTHGLTEN